MGEVPTKEEIDQEYQEMMENLGRILRSWLSLQDKITKLYHEAKVLEKQIFDATDADACGLDLSWPLMIDNRLIYCDSGKLRTSKFTSV